MSENPLASLVVTQVLPVTNGAEPGIAVPAEERPLSPANAPDDGAAGEMAGVFSALLTGLERVLEPTGIPLTPPPTTSTPAPPIQPTIEATGKISPVDGHVLPPHGDGLPPLDSLLDIVDYPTEMAGDPPELVNPAEMPIPSGPEVERQPSQASSILQITPAPPGIPQSSLTAPPPTPAMTSTSTPIMSEPAIAAGARTPSVPTTQTTADAPSSPGIEAGRITGFAAGQEGTATDGEGGERPLPQSRAERTAGIVAEPNGQGIRFDRLEPPATLLSQSTGIPTVGGQSMLNETIELNLRGEKSVWLEPLAQRLATIAGQGGSKGAGVNTAELQLNPPHLGRLEIRIAMHNDQASIWLSSANPEVRDALQQAMPRLDGLLEELGINLADSEVTEESLERFADESTRTFDEPSESPAEGSAEQAPAAGRRLSILDAWA